MLFASSCAKTGNHPYSSRGQLLRSHEMIVLGPLYTINSIVLKIVVLLLLIVELHTTQYLHYNKSSLVRKYDFFVMMRN